MSTYTGLIKDDVLNNLSVSAKGNNQEQAIGSNEMIYVALNEKEQIIGFASGGKSRSPEYPYDGELYAIYLLKEYQQQGIGRKLIQSIVNELQSGGYQSMIVWVLSQNPSKLAYERLGGIVLVSKDIQIGGQTLREVWGYAPEFIAFYSPKDDKNNKGVT